MESGRRETREERIRRRWKKYKLLLRVQAFAYALVILCIIGFMGWLSSVTFP